MRVLWICNVPIPEAKEVMGDDTEVRVSWLVGISKALKDSVDLYIAYTSVGQTDIRTGDGDRVHFVSVPRKEKDADKFDPSLEEQFVRVYEMVKPDAVHIFGTEFPHTLSAVLASKRVGLSDATVVSIQGLVSIYADHFMAGIPHWVECFFSIRDILRRSNVRTVQKKFRKKGAYEIEAIKQVQNVIGRTDWDLACTTMYHPGVSYHHNNEILRDSFYENRWQYGSCEKHRIFMSQGRVPYKGFHFAVKALAVLKEKYPDVTLYITDDDIMHPQGFYNKIKLGGYQIYLRKLIRKLGVEENIHFLGTLNEEEMCEQYRKANAFILPSAIENSPNSLGEAMLLGVPTVTADMGGVKNMITHEKEGYVYQLDAPYMLAFYVGKLFDAKENVAPMCEAAHAHAAQIFDRGENIKELVAIYRRISGNEE